MIDALYQITPAALANSPLATPTTLTLIAVAFFLAGLVKGTIGLGLPVVVTAVLAATVGLKTAVALLVLPGFLTNIWQGLVGGRFVAIVKRLWPMLLCSVFGIWAGVKVLAVADGRLLAGVLGVVLVSYATMSLVRAEMPPPGRNEVWLAPPVGLIAGFFFGLMGSYMVPGVLYLQSLRLGRDTFVQSLGITFCVISLVLGVVLTRERVMTGDLWVLSAAALLPTVLGMVVGQRVRRHLDEARFRRLFFWGLIVSGLFMVIRALLHV